MSARDLDEPRLGITPKSWTSELHHGVLHLGKRWYAVSAEIDEHGNAQGVRLDGPYPDRESAEAKTRGAKTRGAKDAGAKTRGPRRGGPRRGAE